MITINDQGAQIDERQIANIETTIGTHLPLSYKNFLIRNNGGRPDPDTININDLEDSPTDIKQFFGVEQEFESDELTWNFQLMKENIPSRHLLPIASDSLGNTFCLDLAPDSYGRVIYFDLKGDDSKFYDVAPDFEAFLEKIYPWVGESPEP